ncbi:MAG: hypothetical protein Q8Q09_11560 [Deltaproteobacteria bacterium]|nr:hypothetical protein [Deltaproteobacteria bacterium]
MSDPSLEASIAAYVEEQIGSGFSVEGSLRAPTSVRQAHQHVLSKLGESSAHASTRSWLLLRATAQHVLAQRAHLDTFCVSKVTSFDDQDPGALQSQWPWEHWLERLMAPGPEPRARALQWFSAQTSTWQFAHVLSALSVDHANEMTQQDGWLAQWLRMDTPRQESSRALFQLALHTDASETLRGAVLAAHAARSTLTHDESVALTELLFAVSTQTREHYLAPLVCRFEELAPTMAWATIRRALLDGETVPRPIYERFFRHYAYLIDDTFVAMRSDSPLATWELERLEALARDRSLVSRVP